MKADFRLLKQGNAYWVPFSANVSSTWKKVQSLVNSALKDISKPNTYRVIIGMGEDQDLSEPKVYAELSAPQKDVDPLRFVTQFSRTQLHAYYPSPILTITRAPLHVLAENAKQDHADLSPPLEFFDSSIWHIHIHIGEGGPGFSNRLGAILLEIEDRLNQDLYRTLIARETLEFQSRMLQNAYLGDLNNGHSRQVSPIYFHSETEKRAANQALLPSLTGLQVSCLLIDDYAFDGLRKDEGDKGQEIKLGKVQWVQKLMGDTLLILNADTPPKTGESWVLYAQRLLEKYPEVDMILLDFFLGRDQPNALELLDVLAEMPPDSIDKKNHFVFSISTFGFAFQHALANHPLPGPYVDFHKGADPVVTPELFKHEILQIIQARQKAFVLMMEDDFTEINRLFQAVNLNEKTVQSAQIRSVFSKVQAVIARYTDHLTKVATVKTQHHLLYANQRQQKAGRLLTTLVKKHYPQHVGQSRNEDYLSFYILLQHLLHKVIYDSPASWPRMQRELDEIKQLLLYHLVPQGEQPHTSVLEFFQGPVHQLEALILHYKAQFS